MGVKESLIITIFSLILCCLVSPVASSDTLQQGDMLNSSTHLVSSKKNFTLGFFSPENSNDSYLGIWYTDRGVSPVWVGNRNKPIYNNSGVLTINRSGKLIIAHDGGDHVELYAGGHNATNTITATLLDSGNFVVREVNSTGSAEQVLWESFDHPTDTLLPGMKLGVNHRTGRNWTLTSWLSDRIPSPGAFTLDWDPMGGRLIVRRRGVTYWTSGILKDKAFEYIVPKPDSVNLNYNFSNVTKDGEEYFTYSLIVDRNTPAHRKIIARWVLDYQGEISDPDRLMIAPVDLCYGYNTQASDVYGGCELWEQPNCTDHRKNFTLSTGQFANISDVSTISNSSLSDCKASCWNDCNCVGFQIDDDTDCVLWRGKAATFDHDYSGFQPRRYVLISNGTSNMKRKKPIWIVIPVVIVLIMLLLGVLCYLRKKIRAEGENETRKENELLALMTVDGYMDTKELEGGSNNGHDIRVFSYACIMAATSSFSSENKLGEGGFGPVYKGKLPEGREIAVKQLSRSSGQGLLEFKNELILIAKLQHMNLVRLLGCCIHGDEKMLVYEYMPNKSLDLFLFDPIKREQLTWNRRFNIIEGIAQGLLYLHKYSRLRIVHRDLKASNILLDENMNPKISDFGMAKIFQQNATEANTNRIVGTYGYMAPEYAMEGIFSTKSDIFSFGVLMLEIVSGRKNNSFYHVEGTLNLVGHAWELWNNDATLELMDPTLSGSCITHQLLRCIHVGLLCVEDCTHDRPTMSDVTSMLTNDTMALPMPKKPAFVTRRSVVAEDSLRDKEKYSVNGLSLSAMDAR